MLTVPDHFIYYSTGQVPTEIQYCYKQLPRPSNFSWVQCLHTVCQMIHLMCCLIYFFCEYIEIRKKQIMGNKYKNKWDKSIYNSNNFNILYLPFEMVYHYYQKLPGIFIKVVIKISLSDNDFSTVWWFVPNLVERFIK